MYYYLLALFVFRLIRLFVFVRKPIYFDHKATLYI